MLGKRIFTHCEGISHTHTHPVYLLTTKGKCDLYKKEIRQRTTLTKHGTDGHRYTVPCVVFLPKMLHLNLIMKKPSEKSKLREILQNGFSLDSSKISIS